MMIYFLSCGRYIKIGVSDTPIKRITAIRTSNPDPIEVLAIIEGGREVESALHSRFATYRYRGEWFHDAQPIREFVAAQPNFYSPVSKQPRSPIQEKRGKHKRYWIEFAKRGTRNPKRYAYRRCWLVDASGTRIKSGSTRLQSIPPLTESAYLERIAGRADLAGVERRIRPRLVPAAPPAPQEEPTP